MDIGKGRNWKLKIKKDGKFIFIIYDENSIYLQLF